MANNSSGENVPLVSVKRFIFAYRAVQATNNAPVVCIFDIALKWTQTGEILRLSLLYWNFSFYNLKWSNTTNKLRQKECTLCSNFTSIMLTFAFFDVINMPEISFRLFILITFICVDVHLRYLIEKYATRNLQYRSQSLQHTVIYLTLDK